MCIVWMLFGGYHYPRQLFMTRWSSYHTSSWIILLYLLRIDITGMSKFAYGEFPTAPSIDLRSVSSTGGIVGPRRARLLSKSMSKALLSIILLEARNHFPSRNLEDVWQFNTFSWRAWVKSCQTWWTRLRWVKVRWSMLNPKKDTWMVKVVSSFHTTNN